jgi:outer membrane immunogenic protein
MALKPLVALAAFGLLSASGEAGAQTAAQPATAIAAPSLPSLALNPEAPSPWTGFYVGSEVEAAFAKGSKPGFGGAAFAGYDRELPNNLVIGVQGSAGYAPYLFASGPAHGFNFAEASGRVGYDMGRFMPYITAGIVFAKSNAFGVPAYTGAADSMNAFFAQGGALQAAGVVGAGFDYAVTDKLTVGVEVRAGAGRAALTP